MVAPAFVTGAALPHTTVRVSSVTARRPAPQMSLRKNMARVAATIPASLVAAAPALAEGTGEGLGIDNALLFLPLVLIPGAFLALFLQFDGSQNKEDFLGAYDERRN